jgi:hypothetical protein
LIRKSNLSFFLILAPSALDKTDPPPTPIAIPKDEIKNVMGSTTVTAAMASEPIHCPTKWCQLKY